MLERSKLRTQNSKTHYQGQASNVLTPILLDGGGRSGTTLVMQLLATSGQIAFDRLYPFEHRYLLYVFKMSRLWGLPKLPDEIWNSNDLFSPAPVLVGPPPWDRQGLIQHHKNGGEFSARCFHALWNEFSRSARNFCTEDLGDAHTAPRYYAEKVPGWLASEIRPLLPSKVIYLIRDARDIWLSALAFNRKRGYDGFGIEANADPDINLNNFINEAIARLARINSIEDTDEEIVFRYEDLVRNFSEESERLGKWLGVTLVPGEVLKNRKELDHHFTTPTADASLERWKTEMSPQTQARFAEKVGLELEKAGYEVGR